MEYSICQLKNHFKIKEQNIPDAWEALKSGFDPSAEVNRLNMTAAYVHRATSFPDAMKATGWLVYEGDSSGDLERIEYNCTKHHDDAVCALDLIAPFVEEGSYIEMEGEEGERWKWKFKDGECIEVCTKFVYDDEGLDEDEVTF